MGLPVKFQGFANYTGPKGKDGFGAQTVPELLTESSLMIDVGSTTGKAGKVFVGLGYQFWKNKFGNAPGVGTQANVLQVLTELHI
jgi:hypothetical protein